MMSISLKKIKSREYYKKHRKDIIARNCEYQRAHREEVKERHARYYKDNRTKLVEERHEWYINNSDKVKNKSSIWAKNNPMKVKSYRDKHRINNIDKIHKSGRDSYIKSLYGMTSNQYEEKIKLQNGTCAICSKPCKTKRRLAIDHDHKTGNIRGLLCSKCNIAIGLFNDDPELLIKAIEYLRFYSPKDIDYVI